MDDQNNEMNSKSNFNLETK